MSPLVSFHACIKTELIKNCTFFARSSTSRVTSLESVTFLDAPLVRSRKHSLFLRTFIRSGVFPRKYLTAQRIKVICLTCSWPPIQTANATISPLGTSDHHDHCVASVASSTLFSKPLAPFHRTVYNYSKADWCGFRIFLSLVPWSSALKGNVNTAAQEVTEWIQLGMEVYIPSRRYQQKTHSQPWFSPECAAAICQRNFLFHKYQRDRTVENLSLFTAARRRCKKTLDLATDRYAKQTRESISSQKLSFKDLWRICNLQWPYLQQTKPSFFVISLLSWTMTTDHFLPFLYELHQFCLLFSSQRSGFEGLSIVSTLPSLAVLMAFQQ